MPDSWLSSGTPFQELTAPCVRLQSGAVPEQQVRLTAAGPPGTDFVRAVEALGHYIDFCLRQVDGARVHRIGTRISYMLFLSVANRALAVESGARDGFAQEPNRLSDRF